MTLRTTFISAAALASVGVAPLAEAIPSPMAATPAGQKGTLASPTGDDFQGTSLFYDGVDKDGAFFTGLRVSTLGLGASLGFQFNSYFSFSVDVNGVQYDKDFENSGVDYDGKLRMFSIGPVISVHPFGNMFRISAGVLYNNNHLKAGLKADQDVTLFGTTYPKESIQGLSGKATFKNAVAPLLMFGFDTNHQGTEGFSFRGNFGIFYQGKARVKVSGSTLDADGNAVELDPTLKSDLERNYENDINGRKWMKVFPVVSIGLYWRF